MLTLDSDFKTEDYLEVERSIFKFVEKQWARRDNKRRIIYLKYVCSPCINYI